MFTKKYLLSLQQYTNIPNDLNLNLVKDNLSSVYSKIDKATKANVLHKNTAARKKSALRIAFNSAKSK
jgi:ribosomal protein S20